MDNEDTTIYIYRDMPIIANRIAPKGSIADNNGGPPDQTRPLEPNSITLANRLGLTNRSRRGDRHYRNQWVRQLWQNITIA